jgi:hypothetical protein
MRNEQGHRTVKDREITPGVVQACTASWDVNGSGRLTNLIGTPERVLLHDGGGN